MKIFSDKNQSKSQNLLAANNAKGAKKSLKTNYVLFFFAPFALFAANGLFVFIRVHLWTKSFFNYPV